MTPAAGVIAPITVIPLGATSVAFALGSEKALSVGGSIRWTASEKEEARRAVRGGL